MISLKDIFFFLSEIQTANSLNDIHWKLTYSDNTESQFRSGKCSPFILHINIVYHAALHVYFLNKRKENTMFSFSLLALCVSLSVIFITFSVHACSLVPVFNFRFTYMVSKERSTMGLEAAITCQSHSHSTYSSQVNYVI